MPAKMSEKPCYEIKLDLHKNDLEAIQRGEELICSLDGERCAVKLFIKEQKDEDPCPTE